MLRLPATVRIGGSAAFAATFTKAKPLRRHLYQQMRLRAGAAACVEQNHTRGRFYASKRSKDNHFLGAFEIAEHLER